MRFRLGARRVILAAALGMALASAVTACSSSSSSPSTSSAPSSAPASSASASAGDSSAAAQIKANWEAFFSGTTSAAKKISLLQNGPKFAAVIEAQARSGLAKSASAKVTAVSVTSPTKATVTYDILLERSGMAASAANTSREIGAVTGVAILGSLVVSQLRSSLTAQLHHLGIPAQFQALVINALETGQIPKNTSAYAGFGKIVQEVIGAAYTAFRDGLHAALYLSAGLMLGTGLLTFLALRSRPLDR